MGKKRKLGKGTTSARRCEVAEKVMNNVDLLTEILLRLPAKALIRFKSVSKQWLSLISDSKFSFKHTQHHPTLLSSDMYTFKCEFYSLSHTASSSHPELSFLNGLDPHRISVYDSCNGLILCAYYRDGTRYVVCNPTTQSHRLLPYHKCCNPYSKIKLTLRRSFESSSVVMACLAFDPSKSPYYYVAVVEFHYDHTPGSVEINLYQSESASWEQPLKLDVPAVWGMVYELNTFWNGAVHWITKFGYHVWFDPYSKKLTGVKLPAYPRILASHKIRFFGARSGRLFLIQNHKRCPLGFRVLEMGGDYCSWVAQYTVNLRNLMSADPGLNESFSTYGFHVVSILKESEREDLSLVFTIGRRFISYNLHRKRGKVLDMCVGQKTNFYSFGTLGPYMFFESLAPV